MRSRKPRREKYASGFRQRLGKYPKFKHDGREVIWLHCVSVGETNAARPLVDALPEQLPNHRVVISTTTKTGQELARKIFAGKADAIFYFPFDFRFSVRRALGNYRPAIILLMETEIWPRLIREAKYSGAKVAIVNGRVSKRSFERYARIRYFLRTVLADIDLALMQHDSDAKRIMDLGFDANKVAVTGNLKFEQTATGTDDKLTAEFRARFGISSEKPLVIAASTHEPEERLVLESLDGELGHSCRLMIAPRHPERFDAIEKLLRDSSYSFVRRTSPPSETDKDANIILLDSIGELRAAYPLAEIVFVGGSLIEHGGQSVLEPAAAGKAIVTGPYTHNFRSIIEEFLTQRAIIQLTPQVDQLHYVRLLADLFEALSRDPVERELIGTNASALMDANRGATSKTIEFLHGLVGR